MIDFDQQDRIQSHDVSFLGIPITADEIIASLKLHTKLKDTCQQVLETKVIQKAAQERAITISSDDVQLEGDRQRRELRLEKASDTFAWLAEQQITPDEWEAGIRDRLLTQKLKEHLFTAEVESYFAQNRLDFEQVVLYQIVLPYEQLANELFYQIEESEISFFEAAHLYDIDATRRQHCGYEGKLHRWSLRPDIAAVVFASTPGELLYPIQTDHGFHLLRVEEFIPAQLNEEIHQEILQRLFQEWLKGELNHWVYSSNESGMQ